MAVECPDCHSSDIIRHGKSSENKQRFLCQNPECLRRTFILDYTYCGRTRKVKQQIVEMSLNSSGIQDIVRVLKVGAPAVIRELKAKKPYLKSVNQKTLENLRLEQVEVEIYKVKEVEEAGIEESELDEIWSFVGKKTNPRWLWHAIDRTTGQALAYVFGRRKDAVFRELKELLEPFGIKRYCTDGWGA